jgi:hypothetical protein
MKYHQQGKKLTLSSVKLHDRIKVAVKECSDSTGKLYSEVG